MSKEKEAWDEAGGRPKANHKPVGHSFSVDRIKNVLSKQEVCSNLSNLL